MMSCAGTRLHILHHASVGPIFGLGMIRELATYGYTLSPGTLYPIMHGLEEAGLWESEQQIVAGKVRKYYLATKSGKAVLAQAMSQVRELMKEADTNDN